TTGDRNEAQQVGVTRGLVEVYGRRGQVSRSVGPVGWGGWQRRRRAGDGEGGRRRPPSVDSGGGPFKLKGQGGLERLFTPPFGGRPDRQLLTQRWTHGEVEVEAGRRGQGRLQRGAGHRAGVLHPHLRRAGLHHLCRLRRAGDAQGDRQEGQAG